MQLPLIIRKMLSPLVRAIPVRIKAGPNRGARWSLPASSRHRAGDFEADRVNAILALVRPGSCFWDIGAHHGYVSLAVSSVVGPTGRVYAFEPSEYNFSFLSQHVAWNARKIVTPVRLGVAGRPGLVDFGGDGSSQTFHIGGGVDRIAVTSLQEMMASDYRVPDLMKIDVEGAEGEILMHGALHVPKSAVLAVSIHSTENYRMCVDALAKAGFSILASPGVREFSARAHWGHDDPDIVAASQERLESVERTLQPFGFTRV